MLLGAHESIAGGVYKAFQHAEADGCEALQIFTKSANQWKARPLPPDEVEMFKEAHRASGYQFIAAHDSYLINLANPDDAKRKKALEAFFVEVERAELLGLSFVIFHPGAHLGSGVEEGLVRISECLRTTLDRYPDYQVKLLLETTAGQGSTLGRSFEEIATVIETVDDWDRLGVCYDTCHTFTAGYDIRTEEAYQETFELYDKVLDIDTLCAFHLNDSKRPLGSFRDRHDEIGKGEIGLEAFRLLVNDRRFENVPGFLEVPPHPDGSSSYKDNLDLLKGMRV